MTRTVNLPPELESRLCEVAGGAISDRLLLDVIARGLEETRADAEPQEQDESDAANARHILADGDLSDCYTLDDLRKALGR